MTFGASLASAISIEETPPPIDFWKTRSRLKKLVAEIWNMAATRRSCFLLSALYDLPFGANRRFHSHSNRIAYLAPGGWSVSAVSLWETGPYLKPTRSSSYGPGISAFPIVADFRGRIASQTAISLPTGVCSNQPLQHNPFGASRKCGVGILVRPGTCTIAGLSKTFPSHGAFSFAL
jgi:hypothetical protein